MWLNNAAKHVGGGANRAASAINYLGMAALGVMMLLTTVDVIGRYVFNSPVIGGIELTQFLMILLAYMSTAYTGVLKGHVLVDIVTTNLSPGFQSLLSSAVTLISIGTFPVVAWRCFVQAIRFSVTGAQDAVLLIPWAPFEFLIGIGLILLWLVLIGQLLTYLSERTKRLRDTMVRLFPGLFALAIIAVIFAFSESLPPVEPLVAGFGGFGLMFVLMFLGMPVSFTLLTVGSLGMAYLRGINAAFGLMGNVTFSTASNYAFCVIPLFVLMSFFCFNAGLGKDLYEAAYKWFGRLPGGLAQATVAACAAFGAIVGTSTAGAITFGTIAWPEMKRYKYDAAMATGCIAAAGTLGTMIPPSTTFILWGLLTEQSVGDLFMAGILPGIMIMVLFMLLIYVRCRFNSALGPSGPSSSWGEKATSLKGIWPILILFVLVIGGLYIGIFTPTEAGGIGAFGAFVIGMAMRRFTKKGLMHSFTNSARLAAMIFLILTGGNIFGSFLAASKLPFALSEMIAGLDVPRLVTLGGILVMWMVLGCIMPMIPITILTTPIFLPTFLALDMNLIWVGVLHTITGEMGVITPPVGINVYVLAGVCKDVPMKTIFSGIWPFFYMLCAALLIILFFPQIALFLPTALR